VRQYPLFGIALQVIILDVIAAAWAWPRSYLPGEHNHSWDDG